jgi:hypothetical protein
MNTIGINAFVRRQVAVSPYSHFAPPGVEDSWSALVDLVVANFDKQTPGYREGVVLVPVPADGFFSGVVQVTPETHLASFFRARRDGEEAYIQTIAPASNKAPALVVEIVLYSRETLGADASPEGYDWEIISINARPTVEPEPMHPQTMARNMLGLPGGTPAVYTAEEFAKAVLYWSTRCMAGGY